MIYSIHSGQHQGRPLPVHATRAGQHTPQCPGQCVLTTPHSSEEDDATPHTSDDVWPPPPARLPGGPPGSRRTSRATSPYSSRSPSTTWQSYDSCVEQQYFKTSPAFNLWCYVTYCDDRYSWIDLRWGRWLLRIINHYILKVKIYLPITIFSCDRRARRRWIYIL